MALGPPIATQRLADLKVGVSSEKDVITALGAPAGRGMWRWAGEERPLELRVYERMRMKSNELDVSILIVFLKNGIYAGHYWFAANPLLQ